MIINVSYLYQCNIIRLYDNLIPKIKKLITMINLQLLSSILSIILILNKNKNKINKNCLKKKFSNQNNELNKFKL